jgi:hypothetical protein
MCLPEKALSHLQVEHVKAKAAGSNAFIAIFRQADR